MSRITATADAMGTLQRILSYRPGGDLRQDAHIGGTTYGYSYNAAKRLVGVTQNGSAAGAYAYDFAGQRVWRQTFGGGAAETAYIYDADGHLLAEHDATNGDVQREYIWLEDLPVALLDIAGMSVATNFIHTGQIDEPLMVTDSGQAPIWDAYVDPYGIATISGMPGTTLDMRLPGQSLQLEAGSLSQNRWRDYDPSLGRYIEADPLGIDAGQNIYVYVDGDPLNFSDPDGSQYQPRVIDLPPDVGIGFPRPGITFPEPPSAGLMGGGLLGLALGQAIINNLSAPNTAQEPTSSTVCDPTKCKPLYDAIDNAVKGLQRRNAQLIEDPRKLPPKGPGSVLGHQDQFQEDKLICETFCLRLTVWDV